MDDTTNITGFQDTNPITETLSGIKIIKLQTNKGDLEVEYQNKANNSDSWANPNDIRSLYLFFDSRKSKQ